MERTKGLSFSRPISGEKEGLFFAPTLDFFLPPLATLYAISALVIIKPQTLDPFERTLLEGCRRGERQAQKELYERYKNLLFGVCLRYAARKEEAEDMLQEGFIQIFRDLYQFQPNRPLSAWMYRVMANACLQYLRRHKRLKLLENYTEETVQQEECAAEREREEVENLLSFVQCLPDGQRAVFNLFAIEGYTHAEIAGILGISESGSKSQLSRARAALRRMMLQKEKVNQEPCP